MVFTDSLRKNIQFQTVYHNGQSYGTKLFVMYVMKNSTEGNRLGISVSKKVGNSIIRHRVKRLVHENYRLHENMFNSGLDIVVIARPNAATATYQEVERALIYLGNRLHIIKENNNREEDI